MPGENTVPSEKKNVIGEEGSQPRVQLNGMVPRKILRFRSIRRTFPMFPERNFDQSCGLLHLQLKCSPGEGTNSAVLSREKESICNDEPDGSF
jgi:hypothetical protein